MSNRKCCVPGCVNSLDTNANLHKFPNPAKDKELFNTWVYSIGGDILQLENEYIFKYRRVCREHFEQKHWCRNNRLSKEAVPTTNMPASKSTTTAETDLSSDNAEANYGQGAAESCVDAGDSGPVEEPRVDGTDICDDDDDDDSDTLVESNVCRVCLALDVKMYDLKDFELREMFQNITGIVVTENHHSILERLCWECAGRLKAAAAFRNKALLSDVFLQGLANTGEQIRKHDVTLIKENKDYLKLAGTLSVVDVFHTVDIDAEYESVPSVLENNDSDIVQNTVRIDSIELQQSIIKDNNDQMDIEDESMIEAPIKTVIEYDPIRSNTGEENINIVLETNPPSNNIPLKEKTRNSAYSSPPPGCSHVETKYPTIGYLLKTPSDREKKIKKKLVKTTKRDSISKIVSKKSKEVINDDQTLKGAAKLKNINFKVYGNSKKTSNQKLVEKTQVKTNTSSDEEYTDVEYLNLENFEC